MGWAGATSLFDEAVEVCLRFLPQPVPEILVRAVVECMYIEVDWADWDTQSESDYYEDHLVHVMFENGEIDFEDYLDYQL